MFGRLVAYKKEHGDCNVRQSWKEDRALGRWVSIQRRAKAQNKLSSQRRHRLESLGFVWNMAEEFWEKMYQELVAYKKRHGHCNMSRSDERNQSLASWVNNQRYLISMHRLLPDRLRRLNALGFTKNTKNAKWGEMYARPAALDHLSTRSLSPLISHRRQRRPRRCGVNPCFW